MNREKIVEVINNFLIEELEVETPLTEESLFKDDLGIDSLDFVDIVVVVDKEFGFKIKPEEMAKVNTLGEFYDYIESKING